MDGIWWDSGPWPAAWTDGGRRGGVAKDGGSETGRGRDGANRPPLLYSQPPEEEAIDTANLTAPNGTVSRE